MSSTDGSPTNTGWKRRSSAASFSMCLRYSSSVVAPTRAQLAAREHRLEQVGGVDRALGGARADDRVQLVDEQDDLALGVGDLLEHGLEPVLELAAVLRARRSARRCRARSTRRSRSDSGTSPSTIRWASPSTIAVLPTPGSPISTGLFFVRRDRTWIDAPDLVVAPDDRVELALARPPRSGRGRSCSSAWYLSSGFWSVTRCGPRTCADGLGQRLARGAGVDLRVGGEREQQVLGRRRTRRRARAPRRRRSAAPAISSAPMPASRCGSPVTVGSASSAALARAAHGLGSAPARASTGTTMPPSCSSSAASRCWGTTCGLRRAPASRCAAASAS